MNTLEMAKLFQTALDKQMIENALSGWMEPNSGMIKYNGGDEVRVPKMTVNGLADYDREEGYTQGAVNLSWETRKLTMDRGRSFHIDAMDVDETAFITSAGTVMGEFQRSQVIPEIDAYRFSAIAAKAIAAGQTREWTPDAQRIIRELLDDLARIQDMTGQHEQLVILMSTLTANQLSQSTEFTRTVSMTDFAQGGLSTKVQSLDGVPILRIPSTRFKTAYAFLDGKSDGQKAGGFQPAATAQDINWLIVHRKAPIAISKTDVPRIFDPRTNQKANAWRIDYRKFHDLWILDNTLPAVFANVRAAGAPSGG